MSSDAFIEEMHLYDLSYERELEHLRELSTNCRTITKMCLPLIFVLLFVCIIGYLHLILNFPSLNISNKANVTALFAA